MKFKFGKYRDPLWCTLHDTYMYKKYGNRFYGISGDFKPTKFDNFVEKLEDLIQGLIYQPLNWIYFNRREQQISVQLEPHDTYSADITLAHVILPTLIQLKGEKHGSPHVDDEDVPEEIRSTADTYYKQEDCETDKFFHDRWTYVLDEMIFAFNTKVGDNQDWEDEFSSGDHDIVWVDAENGMKEMTHGPNNTYKYDKEAANIVANRIQNGFRLFGKYYQNLWS